MEEIENPTRYGGRAQQEEVRSTTERKEVKEGGVCDIIGNKKEGLKRRSILEQDFDSAQTRRAAHD